MDVAQCYVENRSSFIEFARIWNDIVERLIPFRFTVVCYF